MSEESPPRCEGKSGRRSTRVRGLRSDLRYADSRVALHNNRLGFLISGQKEGATAFGYAPSDCSSNCHAFLAVRVWRIQGGWSPFMGFTSSCHYVHRRSAQVFPFGSLALFQVSAEAFIMYVHPHKRRIYRRSSFGRYHRIGHLHRRSSTTPDLSAQKVENETYCRKIRSRGQQITLPSSLAHSYCVIANRAQSSFLLSELDIGMTGRLCESEGSRCDRSGQCEDRTAMLAVMSAFLRGRLPPN